MLGTEAHTHIQHKYTNQEAGGSPTLMPSLMTYSRRTGRCTRALAGYCSSTPSRHVSCCVHSAATSCCSSCHPPYPLYLAGYGVQQVALGLGAAPSDPGLLYHVHQRLGELDILQRVSVSSKARHEAPMRGGPAGGVTAAGATAICCCQSAARGCSPSYSLVQSYAKKQWMR
jgi:hypothetical protein